MAIMPRHLDPPGGQGGGAGRRGGGAEGVHDLYINYLPYPGDRAAGSRCADVSIISHALGCLLRATHSDTNLATVVDINHTNVWGGGPVGLPPCPREQRKHGTSRRPFRVLLLQGARCCAGGRRRCRRHHRGCCRWARACHLLPGTRSPGGVSLEWSSAGGGGRRCDRLLAHKRC